MNKVIEQANSTTIEIYLYSLLVLQNVTTARKNGNILFTYLKAFSSDTHQSIKTSDSDLNRNISVFHLSVLESVYIKTQNPFLCRKKEFVLSLGLFT